MGPIRNPVQGGEDLDRHALCLAQDLLYLIAIEMLKSLELKEVLNAKDIKEGKSDIP
jgi:hypothetical protein